jgi:hypothetical protein
MASDSWQLLEWAAAADGPRCSDGQCQPLDGVNDPVSAGPALHSGLTCEMSALLRACAHGLRQGLRQGNAAPQGSWRALEGALVPHSRGFSDHVDAGAWICPMQGAPINPGRTPVDIGDMRRRTALAGAIPSTRLGLG